MGTTKNKSYEADGYDLMINFIWNIIWISLAVGGVLALSSVKVYDLKFCSVLFMIIGVWFGIFSAHISIRRFDRKYRDRLLNDPRAGLFILIPLVFSRETMIKCRWYRASVYLLSFKKSPRKNQIRKEIIPEFDYKRDVKFWDKFLFWGQFVAWGIAVIIGFWVKW